MVRLALLLVDDVAAAEDVVQDAFIALHRHQNRLPDRQREVLVLRYFRAAVGTLMSVRTNGSVATGVILLGG